MKKQLILSGVLSAVLTLPALAFTQPNSAYPLKAEVVTELLETMQMPRIRLEGKHNIQLDYIDFFDLAKPNKESFLITQNLLPDNKMSLSVYPNSAISGGISQQTVSKYLRTRSEDAARKQEYFEIITMPESDAGPTKIRFLGAKPITVEYAIKRIIDGEPKRIIVQDSWAELEGETYLLRIEAPEDRFKQFFAQCKGIANSMYFVD
ncbi:DUF4148 domain-containing protein [Cerasicoccus arenae]|uniref:Uncharacterized protein n=1 Tax=Cerasicoccus arenae TaxID=424488 RepID=A0A8J3DFX3_9BACT|nr:DUF4148 domain-containing protein [Cerasicoccus arenae]MBK1857475.1 DUF4148 domain-containing protein [Cerasicoccus arenae]GHB95242.1 hypothetical protein GCM10007047_08650 [Cerasicoccus arenae]